MTAVYNRRTAVTKGLVLGAVVCLATPAASHAALTEGSRLAGIYDRILAAQFDDARRELARACPPAPAEACRALEAAALWWELQIDPRARVLDQPLERTARAAIADARRWTEREPGRAEAWFYLAGAHGPLMEWLVLRGSKLSAARSATTIKAALERAVALDPGLGDAYFGIGLYHYVADVAPTFLKFLRWLLLMPGGDRAAGLREMQRGRDTAVLLRGEADYQLHFIYLWYEHEPARALDLLAGLDRRYPTNPIFITRIADIHRTYLHDERTSLAAWQTLLDRARAGRVAQSSASEVVARIGLAEALVALSQAARAVDTLAPLVRTPPTAPYAAAARAHLVLGHAYEQIGDPQRALTAFLHAITTAPDDDPDRVKPRARAGIARVRSWRG
jgi:tetratricopeptide (TPR) repeat protein